MNQNAIQKRALGKYGEELACVFLKDNGYTIVERNYRFHHKEIDIIARELNKLVVVEVKTRSKNPYLSGSWSMTKQKIASVTSAGYAYAQMHTPNDGVRFDSIICQENNDGSFSITHEKDAFCAPWRVY